MVGPLDGRAASRRSLMVFGGWTLGCSALFWAVGPLLGQIPGMPSRLPMAALVFVVPGAVAVALSRREGTMPQLGHQFQLRSCSPWWWLAGVLTPTVATYADALIHHGPWPFPGPLEVAGLGIVYTVSGTELNDPARPVRNAQASHRLVPCGNPIRYSFSTPSRTTH
jgi:hypothetical protein